MMESDVPLTNEYNHTVVSRLLKMAGPYKIWFVLAGFSLIIATIAELSLPVLLQKTIDRFILAEWTWVDSSLQQDSFWNSLLSEAEYYEMGGRIYLRTGDLPSEAHDSVGELKKQGLLSKVPWYVFPWKDEYKEGMTSAQVTLLISSDHQRAALSVDQLHGLDKELFREIRSSDMEGLRKNSILYFLLLIIILFFSFIQIYTMSWTSQGVMKDLRMKMLSHVMNQSLGHLGDTPVGHLVSRITSDVETINEFFTSVTISVLKDLAMMAGVLVTLYILNPSLALITILTLPPILILTGLFRKLARKAYRSQRHWIGRVNAFISEHVTGMEVIKIFGQEKRARKDFDHNNKNLLQASLSEMYIFAVFRPVVDLFSSVSLGVVIYVGAGMFDKGILSLGILIAFIDLIQKFYRPVMDMSEKFTIMQSAMAGGERIFQILDEDNSLKNEGTAEINGAVKGQLEFQNVTFAYKNDDYILKNLSFTVKPGETIAIVGYTGAGKTTIASLAARLWDIQSGKILLDGQDIKSFPLQALRRTLQAVQQDVFLFSGTVSDNIALGSDLSRERIKLAAKQVQADQFIENMENGYDAEIQERGANLSAGQRQLLSFARVLAHDPSIVILDEATANIDSETEKLVQKALDKILEGRTSLVIAHRISTIQKADKILVLSQGELVEQGTHKELIARKDLYYSLYKLQYESNAV